MTGMVQNSPGPRHAVEAPEAQHHHALPLLGDMAAADGEQRREGRHHDDLQRHTADRKPADAQHRSEHRDEQHGGEQQHARRGRTLPHHLRGRIGRHAEPALAGRLLLAGHLGSLLGPGSGLLEIDDAGRHLAALAGLIVLQALDLSAHGALDVI